MSTDNVRELDIVAADRVHAGHAPMYKYHAVPRES